MAQVATWLPLSLLGIELTVRAVGWRRRAVAMWAVGIGVSQMLAAWLGQGAMYALLMLASYALYRVLTEPSLAARDRLIRLSAAAAAVGLGFALGAAGVLPRLATIAETTLSEGYDGIVGTESPYDPFDVPYLLFRLLAPDAPPAGDGVGRGGARFGDPRSSSGPAQVRRPVLCGDDRYRARAHAAANAASRSLALLPRFEDFHEHQPFRVVIVLPIAIAILCGASIDSLRELRGRRRLLWGVVGAALAVAAVVQFAHSGGRTQFVGWPPIIAAVVALVVVAVVLAVRKSTHNGGGLPIVAATLLTVAVIAQPAGFELTGSWLGWPEHRRLQRIWTADESGKRRCLPMRPTPTLTAPAPFCRRAAMPGSSFVTLVMRDSPIPAMRIGPVCMGPGHSPRT